MSEMDEQARALAAARNCYAMLRILDERAS